MSSKEDVIHNNLKIIEQRLRNVYNCAWKAAKDADVAFLEQERMSAEALIESVSASEMDAVRDEYYHLGYKAGYDAAKEEFRQMMFIPKRGRQ